MQRRQLGLLALAFVVGLAVPCTAAVAGFAKKPSVTKTNDGVRIAFAVTEPTDVEVVIFDAKDNIVRHLAAGKLGPNAPKPFAKGVLEQTITWDGNDDDGKLARGAPFTVSVRLGLTATLDRVIGWSGQQTSGVTGVACGPDGTLYVVHSGGLYAHRTTWLITAYDRNGKYLRQVFPGPANLAPEKRKGWPRIKRPDGVEVPILFHVLTRSTYPGAALGPNTFTQVTKDGRLVMFSAISGGAIKHPDVRGGRRLLILGTDGSVPENWLGPIVTPATLEGYGHLALSPDDRYAYVAGLMKGRRAEAKLCQTVWRVPLDGSAKSKVFLGTMHTPGKGKVGLNEPNGLATDADGNLYVADTANDRVAKFKPDGSFVGEMKLDNPYLVKVSRKTGAVYVVTMFDHAKPISDPHWHTPAHNWKGKQLLRFASFGAASPTASFDYPKGRYGGGPTMALDETEGKPVLWLSGVAYGSREVVRLTDTGSAFASAGAPITAGFKKLKTEPLGFFGDVSVIADRVIAQHPAYGHRSFAKMFSAHTGEPLGSYVPKRADGKPENIWTLLYGEMAAGADNNLYVTVSKGFVRRYNAEGYQLPFASTGDYSLPGFWHGHTRPAGMFVDRKGTIYIPSAAGDRKLDDMHVKVIGPDGKMRNESAIHIQNARLGGIAADREGNIYIGAHAQPKGKGKRMPAWVEGQLPKDTDRHHPGNSYKQYATIFKFPPTGGAIVKDLAGTHVGRAQYRPAKLAVKNAIWMRRGGLIPFHGDEVGCHCETTRFDLDAFGRLFIPDIYRFCVDVVDAAGNDITHFGSYGNMDSRGAKSPVPEPAIPFGWPLSVECANDKAYIADLVNRRVVAVRFTHAHTAEVTVP